ncbi:prepilin-type N-terminal cleavage/methylation domain-containing protein [Polynucleobacter sp. AP-Melu-500A-A1]|uniref:prepilin-type N-terminal cleavage/methylation domain-containing protein n=1 Tax=Polynucleobacter sp. AP-Melu-500A-A1 TaxID=2576929 RepID=UPI001C0BD12F|nr:prepilin-type N-terminal cleavage/methylation domain-containing protein [Polynucleobacter sp. AP-Melu-500A-A1]MBU3630711.1 prepilin-type N-terminal cleavage/methylation domain-containing protein [Polynucleobacter sp. AP-Melu-500A-A1]
MQILESNKVSGATPASIFIDGGFTLIEMLIALMIVAILLSLAVLAIPNHDERNWQNNLDQLTATLNAAQDESQSSGIPMRVEIDRSGWRFYKRDPVDQTQSLGSQSTFTPDAYKAQSWSKPVIILQVQFSLGSEYVTEESRISIEQEKRTATLLRSRDGHFSWTSP